MADLLVKACVFLLIIAGGYGLKRIHFFSESDNRLISKIVLNLTLPCAVITSFATGFQRDTSLYYIVAIGLAANGIMFLVGGLLARKQDRCCKYLYGLTIPGYSIGTFIIPFAQSFVGPAGVVVACMFDIGNSLMCTGFTYAILSGRLEAGGAQGALRRTLQKLTHSTVFLTYCALLLLSILGLTVPGPVLQFTTTVGSANSFLSFLMIGTMFELHLDRSHFKQVVTVVLIRLASAAVFALIALVDALLWALTQWLMTKRLNLA